MNDLRDRVNVSKVNKNKFAENLLKFLGRSGMSYTDLSIATGISYGAIAQYATGRHIPSATYVAIMAREMDTSIDEIMKGVID